MNRKFFAILFLVVAAALNGRSQDKESLTNVWTFRLPDRGTESSPALAPDGTIYQGTFHGWLVAVSPEGKQIWKFKTGREIKSSPAIGEDGTIYFGSRDKNIYAVTAKGKLKWVFPTAGWVDSSPAIATNGMICFGSWDKTFYALTPGGDLKWKFATGNIISSSPAIGSDGTIYFGSHDNFFYALNPDGKLKWKFATGGPISASPAIGDDGTIYFGSTDGIFYALNPDGTERWRTHTGGYSSSSPVLDAAGNLYFGTANERCSLTSDGKLRWKVGGHLINTPSALMLDKGKMFTIAAASPSGLARTDGNFLWAYPVGYEFYSSPTVSPEGTVYHNDLEHIFALRPVLEPVKIEKNSWPMWRANPQHTGRVGK